MTPRTQTGLTPATGEAFQPVITSEKGREEGFIKEEKKKKKTPNYLLIPSAVLFGQHKAGAVTG